MIIKVKRKISKLLLFDLDGTLMLSGGAGMRAMNQAFFELFNQPDAFNGIQPDGKTDPLIFKEMLSKKGLHVPDMELACSEFHNKYIHFLADEMPKSQGARLMPGIPELLTSLTAIQDLALGLLTGNFEMGARLKLARFDLNKYFPFGAFGSDDEDRVRLLDYALERAKVNLGTDVPEPQDVLVIGDTPRDIACGKARKCATVGVATGSFSIDALSESGADFVFKDLSDVNGVLSTLGVLNGG